MVKLTDANKAALNQFGDLDNLSVPDALYRAWLLCGNIDETHRIQLLQCIIQMPISVWVLIANIVGME